MKEVTYEEWQKNPTPRIMWVWDDNENNKVQRKVLYYIADIQITYRVIALSTFETAIVSFKHCAEIEEPKRRRMTHKELARWLREKPTREFMYKDDNYIYSYYEYKEGSENEEITEDIFIREDDGEWREPRVEVGE